MSPRWKRLRRILGGTFAGCVMLGLASTTAGSAPAKAELSLNGGGSWGAYRELLTWQDDLGGSRSPIDLGYAAHGSFLGRKDFLDRNLDFVLSGIPFSTEELAQVDGGASGLIDAPVQVSSLAFVLQRPVPDGLSTLQVKCDPDDPNTPDPTKCLVKRPYTGPVKVPSENLAAMALKYAGASTIPLSSWNDPSVLSAMGVPNFTTPPLAGPAPVLRSDQDEMSFYLQQFAATAAPSVWSGLKQQDTRIAWEPITERLPRQAGASRDGVEQQGQQLALGGGDPSSGTISGFTAGVFAAVPASAIGGVKQAFPKAKLEYMQVQNANGDWVAPNPASIDAAVNAGGAAPLFALTNKVPGAYPLVWVDHLYAPAHGLSIEKTEGLAAVIRYLATAGQDAAQPVGEGRLPGPLVTMALAAADQLVRSNCDAPDRHVVESSDPGPSAPDLPAIKTIGTMLHCAPGAPAPAAAAGAGGSSGGAAFSAASAGYGGTSSGAGSTALATSETGATATGGELGRKSGVAAALAATKLPLGLPPASSGLDRLATLLIGAGAYFAFRRPVRRLLARARP